MKNAAKVVIGGNRYVPLAELLKVLGISRQTLWRWRQDGRVPAGAKHRDRALLFTEREAAEIRDFAQRVTPLRPAGRDELRKRRTT